MELSPLCLAHMTSASFPIVAAERSVSTGFPVVTSVLACAILMIQITKLLVKSLA